MINEKIKKQIFLIIVLFLAIIRGSSYLFIKNIINDLSVFEIIFFRFSLTSLILAFIFYKKLINLNKIEIILGFIAATFLFSAFTFQTFGLKYTSISKQSFLTSMYIVIVPLLNFLIFKEKIKKLTLFAFLPILTGLFFISFNDFKNLDISFNIGDFLTVCCAIGFALNILLFSKITKLKVDVINVTIFQMFFTSLFAFSSQILFHKSTIRFSFNFSLLYLILICTLLNFTLQNISQKYIAAHIVSIILSLEAIFGTIFAIIFIKEKISINFIIGSILLTSSFLFIQFYENKLKNEL